jgi:hypothetical protein
MQVIGHDHKCDESMRHTSPRTSPRGEQRIDTTHKQIRTTIAQRYRKEVSAVLRSIATIVDHAPNITKPSSQTHQAIPNLTSDFSDP